MGMCLRDWHNKCSQLSSDTYDIYFANPGLIPKIQAAPADETINAPWMLHEGRDDSDATVEDICDFIVEYINSDVTVCLLAVLVPLSSLSLRFTGPPSGPAPHHGRSIKGRNSFAYVLSYHVLTHR
jgi:hypothetical protein